MKAFVNGEWREHAWFLIIYNQDLSECMRLTEPEENYDEVQGLGSKFPLRTQSFISIGDNWDDIDLLENYPIHTWVKSDDLKYPVDYR